MESPGTGEAMTQKEIHVGFVGANAKSWATVSHVAAINGLPGLRLAAVATRNEQSAREAAEAFGADRWFSDVPGRNVETGRSAGSAQKSRANGASVGIPEEIEGSGLLKRRRNRSLACSGYPRVPESNPAEIL